MIRCVADLWTYWCLWTVCNADGNFQQQRRRAMDDVPELEEDSLCDVVGGVIFKKSLKMLTWRVVVEGSRI